MLLVTGGCGFIGAHTVRAFAERGQACVALTRRPAAGLELFTDLTGLVTVEQGDLTDRRWLARLADRYEITGIVHLAAPPLGSDRDRGRFVRGTVDGLLNLLDAADVWDVPRVSIASSIGVYQGVPDTPYREDARLRQRPVDPIPAVKNAAELLAAVAAQGARREVITLRIATIWGPGNASRASVVPRLVLAAVRGEPVHQPVFADDAADLCYVADCARAIALLQLAGSLRHETYNVGSGRATSPAQIRDTLVRMVPGAQLPLRAGRDPDGPGRDTCLDITRLREDTDYRPEYDHDRGLREYVAWLRDGHSD